MAAGISMYSTLARPPAEQERPSNGEIGTVKEIKRLARPVPATTYTPSTPVYVPEPQEVGVR